MKDPLLTSLRRQLKAEAPVLPAKPAVRPNAPAQPEPALTDSELFAQATKGARRIETAPPAPATPRKPLRPDAATLLRRARAEGEHERDDTPLSDTVALQQGIAPEAFLSYKRTGVQDRQFDQLKAGKLPWRHAVDLHGCTLEQAREALLQLMDEARRDAINVVKVVHGKGHVNGQALLKTAVNGWLRQMPDVLAFASADARNGGNGAVLVLLRRPRREPDADPQAAPQSCGSMDKIPPL